MIEIDVIEIEGSTVVILEVVTDVPLTELKQAASTCVPAWLVAVIVAAVAGRRLWELSRRSPPPRRES